jgi:hypothetical protein
LASKNASNRLTSALTGWDEERLPRKDCVSGKEERGKKRSDKEDLGAANFIGKLRGERDVLKRKMGFVGYLFNALSEQGVDACLVGGEAIELYTAGQFSTGVLRKLNFKEKE